MRPDVSFAVGRLSRLRAVRDGDASLLFDLFSDARSYSMLHGSLPVSCSEKDVERAIADAGTNLTWVIETTENGSVAGYVQTNFARFWHGSYTITIGVAPEYQRRRIGLDARIVHIRHLFEQMNARRVTGFYRADNDGARRLNARLGAVICGVFPDAHFSDGRYVDLVHYSYTREAFMEQMGPRFDRWAAMVA